MICTHENTLLAIEPRMLYVVVEVPMGWAGAIHHRPDLIERAASRYCTNMAASGIPATVNVRRVGQGRA